MPPLKAFRSVLGIFTELDGNPQFSLAHLDFLLIVEELGPIAPLDVARRLKLSKQAAYRTITTLEKASLLTREATNGTAKKPGPVMLTDAARDVLRRVSKVLAKAAAKPAKAAAKPAKTANAASAVPKTSVPRISRARARGAIAARH